MNEQIIPIAKIKEAAIQAVRSGNTKCPAEFLAYAATWEQECKTAAIELDCAAY